MLKPLSGAHITMSAPEVLGPFQPCHTRLLPSGPRSRAPHLSHKLAKSTSVLLSFPIESRLGLAQSARGFRSALLPSSVHANLRSSSSVVNGGTIPGMWGNDAHPVLTSGSAGGPKHRCCLRASGDSDANIFGRPHF